jgi:hypothetical protein
VPPGCTAEQARQAHVGPRPSSPLLLRRLRANLRHRVVTAHLQPSIPMPAAAHRSSLQAVPRGGFRTHRLVNRAAPHRRGQAPPPAEHVWRSPHR